MRCSEARCSSSSCSLNVLRTRADRKRGGERDGGEPWEASWFVGDRTCGTMSRGESKRERVLIPRLCVCALVGVGVGVVCVFVLCWL